MAQYGVLEQASKNIWGFDPTSIGGCTLWLDGADGNTMFSNAGATIQSNVGDTVAVWRDKSVSAGIVFSTITVPTGPFTATGGAVTLPLSSATGIFIGTSVTIAGVTSTGSLTTLNGTYTVTNVSGNSITFPNSTAANSVTTAGTVTIAVNNAIGAIISSTSIVATGATSTATQITYSVTISASQTVGLGMLVGNLVTTTGISPASFNVTNATISSITEVTAGSVYTIVVNSTGTAATATSGGLMTFTNAKFPTRTATDRLSFSGSQYLGLPNPSLLPTGATNSTRFVVSRTTESTRRQTIFNNGSNAAGGGHFLQYNLGGSSPAPSNTYFLANAFPTPFSGSQTISDLHIITGQLNNLIQAGWHNGNQYPSNNNGDTQLLLSAAVNVGTAYSIIGADIVAPVSPFTTNLRGLTGEISEILVYNTSLSNTDRQIVEGYLAWKWGLQTSLPASHPYAWANYFYTNTRPFSRNFVPTDIRNCIMWYDGADLTSMFTNADGTGPVTGTGSIVKHWRDKSGSGNNITNGATGPTLTTSANPRGFDMVFNGTSSFLSNTSLVNNSNKYTKFLVLNRPGTGSNFGRLFAYGSVGGGESLVNDPTGFHVQEGAAGSIGYSVYKSAPNALFNVSNNTYHIITIVGSPINLSLFLDGALTPTASITTVSATPPAVPINLNTNFNGTGFFLGTRYNAGFQFFPGIINEVISYNRQLNVSEYRGVEGYLAWKWGIRNSLPTAHPFFRYPTPSLTPIQPELQLYKEVFDPADLSPTIWLDSADTSTISTTNNRLTSWVSKGSQSLTFTPPNIPYVVEIMSGATIPIGGTGTSFTMSRSTLGIGTLSGVTVTVGATGITNCTLVGGSDSLITGSTVNIENGATVSANMYSITLQDSTTIPTGATGTTFTLSSGPTGSTGTISGVQAYIAGVPIPNCSFTTGSTGMTTGATASIESGADVVVQPGPLMNTASRGIGLDLPYTDFSSGGAFKFTAATNAAYNSTAITLTCFSVDLDGSSIVISSTPRVTLTVNQPIVFSGSGTVIPGTTPISAGTTYFIRSVSTLATTNINFPTNYITLATTSGGSANITLTPGTLSGVTATAGAYLFTFTTSIPHRIPSGAPVTLVLDSHTSTATPNATGTFFGNVESVPSTTQFRFWLTSATVSATAGTSSRLVGNVQYGNNSIISGSLSEVDATTLTLETAMPHNLQDGFVVQTYFHGPSLPSQWAPYTSIAVRSGISTFTGSIAGTTLSVTGGTPPGIGAVITGTGVNSGTYVSGVITAGSSYIVSVASSVLPGATLTSTYATTPITFTGSMAAGVLTVTAGTTPSPGMMLIGGGVPPGTHILSGTSSPFTVSTTQTVGSTTITGTNYSFEMVFPSTNWPLMPIFLNNGQDYFISSYSSTTITLSVFSQIVSDPGGMIVFVTAVGNIPAGAYYVASSNGSNNNITISSSRTLTPLLDTGGSASSLSIRIWSYSGANFFRLCSAGITGSVLNGFNNNSSGRIIGTDYGTRTVWLSGFTTVAPTAGTVAMSTIRNPGIQRSGTGSFAQQYVYGMYPITRINNTSFTILLNKYFNDVSSAFRVGRQTYGGVNYTGAMANYGFTDFRYGGNALGGFSFSGTTTTQATLSYPANGFLLQASGTNLTNSFNTQTSTILMVSSAQMFPIRSPGQGSLASTIISAATAAGGLGGANTTSGGRDFALRPMGTAQGQSIHFSHNNVHTLNFRTTLLDTTSGYRVFSMVFNGTASAVGDIPAASKCAGINGQRYDGSGTFAQNLNFQTAVTPITSGTRLAPVVMSLGGETCTNAFGINPQMFCDAGISELMVFNTSLTLEQRQLVEGYLAQKYACQYILANQSTTVSTTSFIHPYRTNPAIISPTLNLTILYAQGLAAWFDAANSSTIGFASSNNVNSWTTAGGNLALTLIPNGTSYPTLVQDAQNGLPGVRFTSSGTPLGTSSIYNINQFSAVSINNEFTIITVYKQPTFTSSRIISNIIGSSNDPRLAAYTNQFSYRNTTTEQTKNYSAAENERTYVTVYYRRGNILYVRDNGLQDTGATTSGTNLSIPSSIGSIFGVTLGAYSLSSITDIFVGDIYEHIIFRYALTDQLIFQIEGYLAWKWGVQTLLPTTHPYYKVRP